MRDQYAGDVTDAVKFALLRRLAGSDRRLGIVWYYDPAHDGSTDGGHVGWQEDDSWSRVDAEVHRALVSLPERSVAAIEASALWPEWVTFFRAPVPAGGQRRYQWARAARADVAESSVVFLDPDNGPAFTASVKHATYTEIRRFRQPGRVVVVVRFPNRSASHDDQVHRGQQLLIEEADAGTVVTLRVMISSASRSRIVWFDVIDPDRVTLSRLDQFASEVSELPRAKAYVV